MKRIIFAAAMLLVSAVVFATGKTYQVTGPVVEVRPDAIVVMKGNEKWEVGRDANTKIDGELKKGEKVTIRYIMTATDVEAKEGKKPAKK